MHGARVEVREELPAALGSFRPALVVALRMDVTVPDAQTPLATTPTDAGRPATAVPSERNTGTQEAHFYAEVIDFHVDTAPAAADAIGHLTPVPEGPGTGQRRLIQSKTCVIYGTVLSGSDVLWRNSRCTPVSATQG